MLDIKNIIENPKAVKEALLKRLNESDINLDSIIKLYEEYSKLQKSFEDKRAQQNSFNEKLSNLDKKSEEFKNAISEMKALANEVKELESKANVKKQELNKALEVLPNLPDEDVPAGGKESNVVIKEFGEKPKFDFEPKDHVELATDLDLIDFERASKLSGAQFVMYTGAGALLEWALINMFIEEHSKDGYKMVMPPHLLTEESGYSAGQLPKFKDDVYWTEDGNFLLPTAESALANIYRGEILEEENLPIKLFAYTPCYRREAGSYRSNERGTMRIHQFNKVEMFQYTIPEKSEEALEELVSKACKLVEKLGLHYRVSKLAAGDCSAAAAKTFDVEVWLPVLGEYYEVSSASNVRDYQARRGNIRFKPLEGGSTKYVNMLNASGLATSRLMVALLETYQQKDGSIKVPEVLQKWVGAEVIK